MRRGNERVRDARWATKRKGEKRREVRGGMKHEIAPKTNERRGQTAPFRRLPECRGLPKMKDYYFTFLAIFIRYQELVRRMFP